MSNRPRLATAIRLTFAAFRSVLSAQILFFGLEFTRVYAQEREGA